MEIKNLKKAAKRIKKAIQKKERIILYGDADLDGVSATIVLREVIKNLGGGISAVYFPDRETEGYGISEKGLNFLKKFRPALFISLDCGISNFKEITLAKKMGFKVIVIDHHEILDKLPKADIIVDPKQKGDRYSFKELATVGISFKLAEVLLGNKMRDSLRADLLELVALGTIADMMPRIEENKIFIEEGQKTLEDSFRPGIKAFFEIDFLKEYSLPEKISKIISILNIRDVEENLPLSWRILISPDGEKAKNIILKLKEKIKERKEKIREIIKEVEERVSAKEEAILFEGSPDWEFSLLSPVASFFCNKFKKPTFIFRKLKEESQGTVRALAETDSVALMKKCKKLLLGYGGHPRASGFRVKNENLEKFKKCLIKNYESP